MEGIWDLKADVAKEGDKLREVSPITHKTRIDDNGYTHYIFSRQLFKNSSYIFPDNDSELFKLFLKCEDLICPSDGDIPLDIVAIEAKKVLNYIKVCAENLDSPYYEEANIALKNGKKSLVRDTTKLYIGKFTTRDWRRKRFTASINFFMFHVSLLDHALTEMGWAKNKETNNWEKILQWPDMETSERIHETTCTASNLNQLLDFVTETYFEGTNLREIFIKKLKRGFDVDLNDMINVVLFNNGINMNHKDKLDNIWKSFEATTNTRNSRITSNIISFCRYSLGIADHLERVSLSLEKYHNIIFDKNEYPDDALKKIYGILIQSRKNLEKEDSEAIRDIVHECLLEQRDNKSNYVANLRSFINSVLKLLNSKYNYLKIIFEIE